MKTFFEFRGQLDDRLDEVFNQPAKLSYTFKDDTLWEARATIDNVSYDFAIGDQGNGEWEMAFDDENMKNNVTGDKGHGASIEVFATALSMLLDFAKEEKTHNSISFTSSSTEPSRVKLYDRMTSRFAKKHGYRSTKGRGPFNSIKYTLSR